MAEWGMIYDVNNIKRSLMEANRNYNNRRTWTSMFNMANTSAASSQSALEQSYSAAANEAYASYLSRQQSVIGSDVVGSSREQLLSENQAALDEAYSKYMQNFASGQQQIEESRLETTTAIDRALTSQAQNIKDFANISMDYLPYLYEKYRYQSQKGERDLFDLPEWKKFLITDQDGQERLMTRTELLNVMFDEKDQLTLEGAKFFDQMLNAKTVDGAESDFTQFLAESDQDLHDWFMSTNQYDYITETNRGQFKSTVGMDPLDIDYTAMDRIAGWSETDIKGLYTEFETAFERIDSMDVEKQAKDISKELKPVTAELFTLAKDLGIDKELSDEGFTEENITKILDEAVKATKTNAEMNAEWWTKVLLAVGIGGVSGGLMAAKLASPTLLVPVGGQIVYGATVLVGMLVGMVTSGIAIGKLATEDKTRQKELNKQIAENRKADYKQMLDYMTSYSLKLRRQAEIDFSSKQTP